MYILNENNGKLVNITNDQLEFINSIEPIDRYIDSFTGVTVLVFSIDGIDDESKEFSDTYDSLIANRIITAANYRGKLCNEVPALIFNGVKEYFKNKEANEQLA